MTVLFEAAETVLGRSTTMRPPFDAHSQIQRALAVLRANAKREKSINRRVDLDLRIKRMEVELSVVAQSLTKYVP